MSVRRCPECGTVNRPTVPTCECGYIFDKAGAQALGMTKVRGRMDDIGEESPEDLRHMHMHRLTIGWFLVVGFVLICLVSVVTIAVGIGVAILPAAGSFAMLGKGVSMIGKARAGMRVLDDNDAKLPKARLLKR